MADTSDVEKALLEQVISIFYPDGATMHAQTASPLRIMRGFPSIQALDTDLSSGVSNIGIFPAAEASRNTTRWLTCERSVINKATLGIQVVGSSVTFSGEARTGQIAGLLVDGQTFVYRTSDGDTPALVAAVLGKSIKIQRPCLLAGPTLTIPGVGRLLARVVTDGVTQHESLRLEQGYSIMTWCPSPMLRDQICGSLLSSLSDIVFLRLADGSSGRLKYRSTVNIEDGQDGQKYRRDTLCDVEYGVFSSVSLPSMLFGEIHGVGGSVFC